PQHATDNGEKGAVQTNADGEAQNDRRGGSRALSKDPDRVRCVAAKHVDVFPRSTPNDIRRGAQPQPSDATCAASGSGGFALVAEIVGHLPAEVAAELRRKDSEECAKERVVARVVVFHRARPAPGGAFLPLQPAPAADRLRRAQPCVRTQSA